MCLTVDRFLTAWSVTENHNRQTIDPIVYSRGPVRAQWPRKYLKKTSIKMACGLHMFAYVGQGFTSLSWNT